MLSTARCGHDLASGRQFRAFDAETGEVLWDQPLPARIAGDPITYLVDGKQYVATLHSGLE